MGIRQWDPNVALHLTPCPHIRPTKALGPNCPGVLSQLLSEEKALQPEEQWAQKNMVANPEGPCTQ